jgi:hypothetical protein
LDSAKILGTLATGCLSVVIDLGYNRTCQYQQQPLFTPLILAGHFWDGLLDWAKGQMLRPDVALASPSDLEIPQILYDGPSIVRAILDHRDQWKRKQA